jgi:hypothetical protein
MKNQRFLYFSFLLVISLFGYFSALLIACWSANESVFSKKDWRESQETLTPMYYRLASASVFNFLSTILMIGFIILTLTEMWQIHKRTIS